MFYRKTYSENFWKDTQSVQNTTFELWEKMIQRAYWIFTKNRLIFPGFSKGTLNEIDFYTSEIKQKPEHFVQQLRCYDQSNWTYKFSES